MKIVAWNVAHQVRDDPLHTGMLAAIRNLDAEVIVLTEYVHKQNDPSREALFAALLEMRYTAPQLSRQIHRGETPAGRPMLNNQVLIAAREEIQLGDLHGPKTHDHGGETNFLHIILADGLQIVGLRVPTYEPVVLRDYWAQLQAILETSMARRILFVGDLNVNPDIPKKGRTAYLRNLQEAGWQVPRAEEKWSYETGTCIDHAIASPSFPRISVRYVADANGVTLAEFREARNSRPKCPEFADAVSDHAALVVDLDR